MQKRTASKTKKKIRTPIRSSEVPVTQAMLYGVRDELKAFVKAQNHDTKAEFKSEMSGLKTEFGDFKSEVRTEINGLKSEINDLKSDVGGLHIKLHSVDAKIYGLQSEVHKLAVLIEEQNARNIIVLDGLTGLFGRQERVETRVDSFEKLLLDLKGSKASP